MTLTFKVATQMLRATRRLNMVIIFLWNIFEIPLQITTLWAGHDFATRSCFDIAFKIGHQMLHATRRLNMVVIYKK